jgi:hypothetical protein
MCKPGGVVEPRHPKPGDRTMDTSPIDSWEGVSVCFTYADQPGMIGLFCGIAALIVVGFLYAIIKHESDAFDKHPD